jgi:hypothetical protein
MRGEQLFLQAADRQHLAAQGHFAGHGHVAANLDVRQRADQRRGQRNARRRTVLGDGAFGNVYVHIEIAVELFGQSQLLRSRAHIAHCRLGRLLHYVAQFAGQHQLALAVHQGDFHRQDLAADLGPG